MSFNYVLPHRRGRSLYKHNRLNKQMHDPGKIIDVTVPLQSKMPIWPGSTGIRLIQNSSLEAGDSANTSRIDCDVHAGTHIDAPKHFIKNGTTVEQLALDIMVGPCFVAYLPKITSIRSADLAEVGIPSDINRLLLRTRNSELWASGSIEFKSNYAALTVDAAEWVVENKIRLIGIDYLSVQRYQDGPATHKVLLQADTIILEGLNLKDVAPGLYELICLPLKLLGAEAAPARAVLRSLGTGGYNELS